MSNTGFTYLTNKSTSGVGTFPWGSTANVTGAPDTNATTCGNLTPGDTSDTLIGIIDFTGILPSSCTVNTITVGITRKSDAADESADVVDSVLKLSINGSLSSDKANTGSAWAAAFATPTYGGDLWGLGVTQGTDVLASFQILLKVAGVSGGGGDPVTAYVDAMYADINYTVVAPITGSSTGTIYGREREEAEDRCVMHGVMSGVMGGVMRTATAWATITPVWNKQASGLIIPSKNLVLPTKKIFLPLAV